MSYTNVIFFSLALLVYTTYPAQEGGSVAQCVSAIAAALIGYAWFTWFACRSFLRKLEGVVPAPGGRVLAMMGGLEQKLMVLALFVYFYVIFGAGFEDILWRIALLKKSSFLHLVAGLCPFVLLLMILWLNLHALVDASAAGAVPRKTFFLAQAKLNGPIVLPVFLFSAFLDLLNLLWGGNDQASQVMASLEPYFFIPFLLILILLYPLLLRRIWGCYPLPHGDRRRAMEEACRKAGLRVAEIYLWPSMYGKTLTAGIAGLIGRLRYLFVTPGLLNLLNDQEMEAVIAHEAGHIRKGHVYCYVLVFFLLPLAMFLFYEILTLGLYGFDDLLEVDLWIDSFDPEFFAVGYLVILSVVVLFYLRVFFGLLSRNFEREADLFVFDVVGHPLNLISSLEKISFYGGYAKETPSWHHFGIGERIRFLEECGQDMHRCAEHGRKARRIKVLCLSLVVIAVALVGVLNIPASRTAIKAQLLDAKIERMAARRIEDPAVLMSLAMGLQEAGRYQHAVSFYEQVLSRYPDNEVALNNLAWLYATAEDKEVRNTAKALALAQKAAAIKQEAYILDTLAEAYFVNGMREEAFAAIDEAIALKPENMEYYLEQKKKFADAELPE